MLIRCRLKPVSLTGDLKQAFLQVRINENDCDSLRFHLIKNSKRLKTVILQFTRLMFGLSPSSFVIEGTIKYHLERYEKDQPETIMELNQSMHIGDVIGEGDNMEPAKKFKENIVKMFNEAGLHKWRSNVAELQQEENVSQIETDETYVKQQLSKGDTKETILGISWNKQDDQLEVKFPQRQTEAAKRGVLKYLATVYEPISLISPTLVRGKMIFR